MLIATATLHSVCIDIKTSSHTIWTSGVIRSFSVFATAEWYAIKLPVVKRITETV